ncbi:hypothetical protein [Sinorhizobium alkalisoli]|nr:hypothetical protein [Sinorhizobium alkalisoli]
MRPEPEPEMTPEAARRDHWQMLRYLAVNSLYGALVGTAVAAALIWLNIGAVGTHIVRSANPFLASAMVVGPFALLFAGAVAASSIALLPYRRKFRR